MTALTVSPIVLAARQAQEVDFLLRGREITLVPATGGSVERPGGGRDFIPSPPRAPQTFVLLTLDPLPGEEASPNDEGAVRRRRYQLTGRYDAAVAIGDTWSDAVCNYNVEDVNAENGWKTVCSVTGYLKLAESEGPTTPVAFALAHFSSTGALLVSATHEQTAIPVAVDLAGNGALTAIDTASYASAAALSGSGALSATATPITLPAPLKQFNFSEGSGNTTTATDAVTTMTSSNPAWGSSGVKNGLWTGKCFGNSNPLYADHSVALDLLVTLLPTSEASVWSKHPFLAQSNFLNIMSSGKVKIYGAVDVLSTATVPIGTPFKLVLTQDTTTLRVYLDGVEIINSAQHRDIPVNCPCEINLGINSANMELDRLCLWNVALTPTQVAAL